MQTPTKSCFPSIFVIPVIFLIRYDRKNKDYPYGIIYGSVQSAPSELGLIPFWGLVGEGWYALALAQRPPPFPLKRRRDPESDWICRTNIDVSMSADFEGYVVKVLLAPKWVRRRETKLEEIRHWKNIWFPSAVQKKFVDFLYIGACTEGSEVGKDYCFFLDFKI